MQKKESKNRPGVLLAILGFSVLATLVLYSFVENQNGPKVWAEKAPLETVVIGSAEPDWTILSKRISERDRRGLGLDQLQEIVKSRKDNPDGDLMPIPYGEWLQGRTDPPWARYCRK